jgi:hypothetical protein
MQPEAALQWIGNDPPKRPLQQPPRPLRFPVAAAISPGEAATRKTLYQMPTRAPCGGGPSHVPLSDPSP